MKFSENERKFLEVLVDNSRASDVEIADKIKLSSQAVGKIRKKLERVGVIKGYKVELDLEKLGINILALFKVNFLPKFWENHVEEQIRETVKNSNHIISAGRLVNADENLFSIGGFRNQDELESYLRESMGKFKELSVYKKIDIFSVNSLIKMDKSSLYKSALKGNAPNLTIQERTDH